MSSPRPAAIRAAETAALALYGTLLALVIPRHESWGDEQTAWLLARDNSLPRLFTTVLRHEGTPGLWHSILWLMVRLHLSFSAAHVLCGIVAFAGAAVVLRFAPFPIWIRALLPFTFFLLYQYAVVARQYVFFPLLAFGMCALVASRTRRPWLLAITAGLLANDSAHGFCFVAGFAVAVYLLRHRPPFAMAFASMTRMQMLLVAAAMLFAVATAVPLHHTALPGAPTLAADPSAKLAIPEEPLDIQFLHIPPAGMNGVQTWVWRHTMLRANNAPENSLDGRELHAGIIFFSLLTYPISSSNLLALVFLLALGRRLYRQHTLILLLPYGLLFTVCLVLKAFEHHTGMLFVALIAALWMSFVMQPAAAGIESDRATLALLGVLFVVTMLQVAWGVHAVLADIKGPYTGDEASARYLAGIDPHKTIAFALYANPADPPYFTRNFETPAIAAAIPQVSIETSQQQQLQTLVRKLALHPDIVVEGAMLTGDDSLKNQLTPMARIGGSEWNISSIRVIVAAGYHETHRFCGENFMRGGYSRRLCQIVYEKN